MNIFIDIFEVQKGEKEEQNTTKKTGPMRVGKKKHQIEINLARNGEEREYK